MGWNGGDSLAATAAKGIKFFADSKLGFNFLMDRFPSPSFSFAKQAPIAAAAFGWIASDRGVCLSAIFNVYQNAKGLSLAQLQEVVGLPSLQVICSRVDQDSTRQKEVVKKTLGVVMYSSAAMMAVYKIFHKQVASSYPLAVLNTALCGVAVVSGILFDRWKDNSSMPARL
ncbi:MAG: hypothetical protein LVR00_06865 [Rhabdochlamydiaceae bacterium]